MDESGQEADHSTAIRVGAGAQVGDITIQGDAAGRDIIKITEELTYDVSDLAHNPYLGLASYTYATRAFYGGREQQIRDAVARLTAPGDEPVLLFVTGASGSGKSSFAQAGLLPALEEAYTAQGRHVSKSVTRPGRHPIEALGRALEALGMPEPQGADWSALLRTPQDLSHLLSTQTPTTQVNVLVFDQFEELFTQADPAERDITCALLSGLESFRRLRIHVLATLRADYLPALFHVPALFERAKTDGIELRAMSSEELAEAIRRPLLEQARREGKIKRLDPALVDRLVKDVSGEPAEPLAKDSTGDAALLPLVQVTLRALWDDPPHKLVLGRYESLTHALEQQANRLLEQDRQGHARPADERAQLMSIFLDLVEVSLDNNPRRDVRRTLPKQELLEGHPERAKLVEALVNARLLTTSVDDPNAPVELVDIIHETLLDNWPRLREAITAQREALQSRERFRLALRDWVEHKRSPDYLLQGVRLAEGQELAARRDVVLNDFTAQAFIAASTSLAEEVRQRELVQARALAAEQRARFEDSRRSARRLRIWLGAAVAAALAAVVAALLALQQLRINASYALAAQAEAQLATDPELSILLAVEGRRTASTAQADEALRRSLLGSPARLVVPGTGAPLTSLAVAPDGSAFAAAAGIGVARVWDIASGQLRAELRGHAGPLSTVAFSADGSRIVTASDLDTTPVVWDARTGARLTQLPETSGVLAAAFSPDGQLLATALVDGMVRLWDPTTGARTAELRGHSGRLTALSFSRDGTHLLTASLDQTARVWDLSGSGRSVELRGHGGVVNGAVFDGDGRRVVTSSADSTARVWDATSGILLGELARHEGGVNAAEFSPNGAMILTAGMDGVARIWDASSFRQLSELRAHTAPIAAASFSPDGRQVLTASYDYTALVWDAQAGKVALALRGHTREVTSAQFTPDGRRAVTIGLDGTARTWRVDRTQDWLTLRGHSGNALGLAFSPDGRRLATGGSDNFVRMWLLDSGVQTASRQLSAAVSSTAFSPDGRRLAIGLWDGTLHLTDPDLAVSDAHELVVPAHSDWIYTVAYSGDGQRVLTASRDHTARLWDATSGRMIGELVGHTSDVTSATFSPDGRRVATSSNDGTARLWNAETFREQLELHGHVGVINSVAFAPDGRRVITAGADATARVWDTDSGREIAVLRGHAAAVLGVAVSPDNRQVLTSGDDHTIFTWDATSWQRKAELRGCTTGGVRQASFDPQGQQVAAVCEDGLTRVYPQELFAPLDELEALVPSRVTRQSPQLTPEERTRFLPASWL
jgi:WD40 repeat protein